MEGAGRAGPEASKTPDAGAPETKPRDRRASLGTPRNVLMNTGELGRRYLLPGKLLGKGQYGVVTLCIDKSNGNKLACKTIAKHDLDPEGRRMAELRNEIAIMDHLSGHPNIVCIRDVYEDPTAIHIITDLCDGGCLMDLLRKQGPLSEARTASIFRVIVKTVIHCHRLGVVHRDLKPENFLLSAEMSSSNLPASLKLSDFGLSTFFRPGVPLDDLTGSPYYLAPEVLKRDYGPEADIWSCGVILYVMLSGEVPFPGSTVEAVFRAVQRNVLEFLGPTWALVSKDAKSLLRRLLTKDPRFRITAEQVLTHPWMLQFAKHPVVGRVTSDLALQSASVSVHALLKAAKELGLGPKVAGLSGRASPSALPRPSSSLVGPSGAPSPGAPSPSAPSPGAPSFSGAPSPSGHSTGGLSPSGATPSRGSSRRGSVEGTVALDGSHGSRDSSHGGDPPPLTLPQLRTPNSAPGASEPGRRPGSTGGGSGGGLRVRDAVTASRRDAERLLLLGGVGAGGGRGGAGLAPMPADEPVPFSPKARPVLTSPLDPRTKARVEAFVDAFVDSIQGPYLRLLQAQSPATVVDESGALYAGLKSLERVIACHADQADGGAFFLGREPSVAEYSTAPMALKMLATLPALRSLDLVLACRALGCAAAGRWFAAVAADPTLAAGVPMQDTRTMLIMARKMYLAVEGAAPPPPAMAMATTAR